MQNGKKVFGIKKLFGILFFIFPPIYLFFLSYFAIKFETNPSSTAALGYIGMPVYAILGLIPGFILRMLGLYIGESFESKSSHKSATSIVTISSIFLVCILAISASALTAYIIEHARTKKIAPRVLLENEHIKKEKFQILNGIKEDNWNFNDNRNVFAEEFSTKILDLENSKLTIRKQLKFSYWNGQKVYLCYDDANAYILKEESGNTYKIIAKHSIRKISYITNIKGFEIEFNGQKYFVLLTVLRATLQRSFLTIYSPKKEIIYQELTGKTRTIKPVTINNKAYLLTGNERVPEYMYYWQ